MANRPEGSGRPLSSRPGQDSQGDNHCRLNENVVVVTWLVHKATQVANDVNQVANV
jgi:hypothetical protein